MPRSSRTPVNIRRLFEALLYVRASTEEIYSLLAAEGVVARRDHPELGSAIAWLSRRGDLVAILPGIYTTPASAQSLPTRIRALRAWDPDAVVAGFAAARLTFWPEVRVEAVECLLPHVRITRPGFQFSRRQVPAELLVERRGVRLTSPALTALDLCPVLGGESIDQALRSRATTLSYLWQAMELSAGRNGNLERRRLLLDSRDQPWSEAERLFHRLLRAAGLRGWCSNFAVRLDGADYYIDVAFPGIRLAVEIDGRKYHSAPEVFESDRWRQNRLILDGWQVLRFTWSMLEDNPEAVIAMLREAVAAA